MHVAIVVVLGLFSTGRHWSLANINVSSSSIYISSSFVNLCQNVTTILLNDQSAFVFHATNYPSMQRICYCCFVRSVSGSFARGWIVTGLPLPLKLNWIELKIELKIELNWTTCMACCRRHDAVGIGLHLHNQSKAAPVGCAVSHHKHSRLLVLHQGLS